MKKWIAAGLVLCSFLFSNPVFAFYDDVHYALNYYIARVIGYTPEQAYRLANTCVSVDYSFSSEPTQMTGGAYDLGINNILAVKTFPLVSMLTGAGHKIQGSSDEWQKASDEVPAAFEEILTHDEFKDTFRAQWRFHAFRDTYRFPHSKIDGPPYPTTQDEVNAVAADEAIIAQRNILLNESYEIKNLGVFLHFFQDEVPHHGYTIGGGHWVLLPVQWEQSAKWEQGLNGVPVPEWQTWKQWVDYDKRGSIPAGSTSYWLSYRSVDSNLKLIRETANYMIEFMKKASKDKQKPLIASPDQVVEIATPVLHELRKINEAPPRLKSMQDVINTKLMQNDAFPDLAGANEGYRKERIGKHMGGPNVAESIKIMNNSLKARNIEPIPPISEPPDETKLFHVVESSATTGALIEELNEAVMYGELTLKFDDPDIIKKTAEKPRRLEVTISSVPSQKDEKPYELLKDSSNNFGIESFAGKEVLFNFVDLPMGELNIQVRYLGNLNIEIKKIEQRVKLQKKLNDVVIKTKKNKYELAGPIVAALKSIGYKTETMTQSLESSLADGGEQVTANKGRHLGGDTFNQPYTGVRVSKWLTEEKAKKRSWWDMEMDHKLFLLEQIPLGGGKAMVAIDTNDVHYGVGVEYPTALAKVNILCGTVTTEIWHYVRSTNSFEFKKQMTPDEYNVLSNQADKDAETYWPQAIAEAKGILTEMVAAFKSYDVCNAKPTTFADSMSGAPLPEPVKTAPADKNEAMDEAQNLENNSDTKPEDVLGLNAAVSPAASEDSAANAPGVQETQPAAPSSLLNKAVNPPAVVAPGANRKNYYEFAASHSLQENLNALASVVSVAFESPATPDAVAFDAYAALSLHIARRNFPVSCFSGDSQINEKTWDAHRAWSERQGRAFSGKNALWKINAAMACMSSKQGQDNLYADIADSMWQANAGGAVARMPDLGSENTFSGTVPSNTGFVPPFPVNNSAQAPANPAPVPLFPDPNVNSNSSSGLPPSVAASIQGFADHNAPAGVMAPAGTAQIPNEEYEPGVDRPGSDYRSFDMDASAIAQQCQSECQKEWPQCRAWTYVNAGVQAAAPRCWLKNAVPPGTAHSGTTSGVMPQVQGFIDHADGT